MSEDVRAFLIVLAGVFVGVVAYNILDGIFTQQEA